MLKTILVTAGFMLVFSAHSQLTITATAYSTRCTGSSTGLVEIESQGAVGDVVVLTNLNLAALEAGTYSITAEDGSGQQASVGFTILDNPNSCGCTYPAAFNFDNSAQVEDGSCVFSSDQSEGCLADIVPDGVVGTNDLLQLLVEFGVVCAE